ncbi:transcriptional regulator [bacterium]|nr:transcriptional regulator [bacterium]
MVNINQKNQIDIDKLIHEPARLKILAQLYVVESADFVFLMRQTGLTQGNVSTHLNKLELAHYVKIEKGYLGKRPRTMISLSKTGREAFTLYVKSMQQMFDALIV